jgi:hypothetical protein
MCGFWLLKEQDLLISSIINMILWLRVISIAFVALLFYEIAWVVGFRHFKIGVLL